MLFLDSVRDPATLAQIEDALSDGRVNDAYAIVDSYVVRMADAVLTPVTGLGQQEAQALAVQAGAAGSGVAVSFNPMSPEVVEAMSRNRMEFIRDFTADQRLAVNEALQRALREGLGPAETTREFRDAIGLTSYQQSIVDRYRSLLENNSSQALDYQLRDRRYDRGLENAIDGEYILSDERIDMMVDRYRERLLQMRGETIARTESGRVLEEVRNLTTYQVADSAGIPYDRIVKVWMATQDARTRETHENLSGQARLLEDAFLSESGALLMYPHDRNAPAEEVINCRCQIAHQIFSTDEEVRDFLLENGQGFYDDALA
jgi:hypothetical protein